MNKYIEDMKNNKPIITSLLDTDLYKLTMQQAALHQFPTIEVEYEFKCRNEAKWTEDMLSKIYSEVHSYCSLTFTEDELNYLSSIRFFKKDFIDFLSLYKPNEDHINIWIDTGELKIKVKGPWYLTIPFEVPVLAIVNEVYFKDKVDKTILEEGYKKTSKKFNLIENNPEYQYPFADFGTRRRLSKANQARTVSLFSNLQNFVGTSNVMFAKQFHIKPIGTMAHEYIMVGQGREDVPLKNSQKAQLQSWVDEYRGDLGIALSDTVGIDAFLTDFDLYFAKLYDGLRHDSGDPGEWADKVIAHYKSLGIDPLSKKLVFSDGLDIDKAADIWRRYKDKAQISFGIGTHLTNDFTGLNPLQIVMKIVEVNGRPVAKISDSKGKGMCKDEHFLTYLKDVFKIDR